MLLFFYYYCITIVILTVTISITLTLTITISITFTITITITLTLTLTLTLTITITIPTTITIIIYSLCKRPYLNHKLYMQSNSNYIADLKSLSFLKRKGASVNAVCSCSGLGVGTYIQHCVRLWVGKYLGGSKVVLDETTLSHPPTA